MRADSDCFFPFSSSPLIAITELNERKSARNWVDACVFSMLELEARLALVFPPSSFDFLPDIAKSAKRGLACLRAQFNLGWAGAKYELHPRRPYTLVAGLIFSFMIYIFCLFCISIYLWKLTTQSSNQMLPFDLMLHRTFLGCWRWSR